MDRLQYDTLAKQGCQDYLLRQGTEKVLQFGEGNFLRAFADFFIDVANEKAGFGAKVVVAQPIAKGLAGLINEQEGLYTLYLRGFEDGQRVEERRLISCVSRAINPYEDYQALLDCARNPDLRYIISNTTEAGIAFDPACGVEDAPPASFPAKLTRFLLERFRRLGGGKGHGLVVLSCELIDNNGAELQKCVERYIRLWELEDAFAAWVKEEVLFCSTLVDRIVTGYPREEAASLNAANGYEDKLLVTGEVFGLWVIEGPQWLAEELPFAKAGLPVMVVENHAPYKQRKVRILNGAHTSMVPAAYLAGQDIVRDCMADPLIRAFLDRTIAEEIIPTLTLPRQEVESFAASVAERFQNPFIDHSLLSITLNCTSKWRARVLPSLKGYVEKTGELPPCLTFSFAAYLAFYRGRRLEEAGLMGRRGEEEYLISDDRPVLEFFFAHRDDSPSQLAQAVCGNVDFWGEDLGAIPGFVQTVAEQLARIESDGMVQAMARLAVR